MSIAEQLQATAEGAHAIRAAEDVTVHDAIRRAGASNGLTPDQSELFAALVDEAGTLDRCANCRGPLIGTEIRFGTCGHCGGRSLNPRRKR
jgi:hypothetical protein